MYYFFFQTFYFLESVKKISVTLRSRESIDLQKCCRQKVYSMQYELVQKKKQGKIHFNAT